MTYKHIRTAALLVLATITTAAVQAATMDSTSVAVVYINPGHADWSQFVATINHTEERDTLGFYETHTNLWKSAELRDRLINTYGFSSNNVHMSRTLNGITEDDGDQLYSTSTIKQAIKSCNADYVISVHSNAINAVGDTLNYFLNMYDGQGNYSSYSSGWRSYYYVSNGEATGTSVTDRRDATPPSADMGIAAISYVYEDTVAQRLAQHPHSYCGGDTTYHYNKIAAGTISQYVAHVLKDHGRPGYQAEATAHSYQPEAHRLLNKDYCRQEGWRYASAINGWFGGNAYTKGAILGTVKDGTVSLESGYYTYAKDTYAKGTSTITIKSYDKYYPLNKVTVYLYKVSALADSNDADVVAALLQSDNDVTLIGSYTTDGEYNGIYYFEDLEPGYYVVDYSHISGYKASYYQATVTADETTYHNELKFPETVEAGDSYEFEQVGKTYRYQSNGYKIRRALYRDNMFYILSHDITTSRPYTPHLRVVDPDNCQLMKVMDTSTNINTEAYSSNNMLWSLSDIAFTDDGVLIGTNSNSLGYSGSTSSNITGAFYMYSWGSADCDTTTLWASSPSQIYTLAAKGATSSTIVGGNTSNLMSNTFDISGDYDDFYIYFEAHAGKDWTKHNIRFVRWNMQKQDINTYSCTDDESNTYLTYDGTGSSSSTEKPILDEYARMILSPLSDGDSIIVDGKVMNLMATKPSWVASTSKITCAMSEILPESSGTSPTLDIGTAGGHFFSYGSSTLFVTPVYTPANEDGDNKCHFGLRLYDVTNGLGAATQIGSYKDGGESEYLICSDTLGFMAAFGKYSECGDIDLYLIVDDSIAKVSSRQGFYICGPAVQTEYCEMNNWDARGDTVNAVPLTKHSDGYYYYDVDGLGNEGALTMEAQKEFTFSQGLDFTRDSTFWENSIVPVDMHEAYEKGTTTSTTEAYEENVYALASGDTYGETQYVNFLTKAGSSSNGGTLLAASGVTAPTFNLPSGDYTIRLYIDKDVTVGTEKETLSYYLIKDRNYRFYDPEADNDIDSYATYKSFYDCHAVLIPSDVDILYVTGVDGGTVYMAKVDKTDENYSAFVSDSDFILPAYTPVVLASETTTGDYAQWRSMEYYTGDVNLARDTFLTANRLKGQLSAVDLTTLGTNDSTIYIFGYKTERDTTTTTDSDGKATQTITATTSVGFHIPYSSQTGAVNTVYLPISTSSADSKESFLYVSLDTPPTDEDDDETTVIDAIVSDEAAATVSSYDDEYYTLQGVRLGKERPAMRGVYIRNGKKVIID